jgi:FkbM family methyltransferase
VDVGANWGYFTLLAAGLVGPRGRVLSLEPDPRLYARLTANLQRNDLGHVTACPVAAADQAGTLRLAGFDEQAGNWGLSRLTEQPAATTFAVRSCPVDALLDELGIGEVELLKMDIEGAEDLALRGMRAGLDRQRYRRILLEVHPTLLADRGLGVAAVLEPLQAAGYRAWRIDHSAEATRRAAYARTLDPATFLCPLEGAEALGDSWPHLLWESPSVGVGR